MPLITLDFETYYDADYTLKKLSTSEYIRDKRFEAISCSIKIDKKKPFCYFGEDIKHALSKISWLSVTLLAHHTHFDGLILSHHYGFIPGRYADTLSMARALHPKSERASLEAVAVHYDVVNKLEMPDFKGMHLKDIDKSLRKKIAIYNNGDVESCYQAYQKMLIGFPPTELDLIDITVRMFADPVLCVNLKKAEEELLREQTAKAEAIKNSGCDIETLSSNKKFVLALTGLGVDVQTKPSPTVPGKFIPAVAKSDEALQALLTHPDEQVVFLVEGRLAAKSTIGESRAARMIMSGQDGMKLPIYLNYAKAHTFRWTGGDKFNPQNFKQKQKVGGALRECIEAPPGYEIVVVDASQIEARVLAWLANEEWLLEAFRQGRDVYSEFGLDVYGRVITKADVEERFVCKTCILGLGFGMGAPKLQTTVLQQSMNQGMNPVRLSLELCSKLVRTYRRKCKNIENLWHYTNDHLIGAMISGKRAKFKCITTGKEKVELPSGLSLLYPELRANVYKGSFGMADRIADASYRTEHSRSKIYGGLFVENLDQALARIIAADKMREISTKYRVVMMSHDEISFLAKKKEAPQALKWAIELMRVPPVWAPDLPLNAEGSHNVYYSK